MALSDEAAYFKEKCEEAETIRLTRRNPGTKCAGGYAAHSDRFDPNLDRAYHVANPSAPVCVNGRVGATETTETVNAFVSVGLNEEQQKLLPLGEFQVDDLLYIGPADTYLTPIAGESTTTVTQMEFPVGSGLTYRLIRPDCYWFKGNPLYWYVKLEAQKRDG